jgi:HEAT repeat protein
MKSFSVLLTFTLVGVCSGAEQHPAATSQGKEPTYEAKTLSEWVAVARDKDPALRRDAVWALGKIGSKAIPALTESLKDKDTDVRRLATLALGEMGSEAKAAVPALTKLLKDRDTAVCRAAAEALGEIGPPAKAAVPALIESLKDRDTDARRLAALALGDIGTQAKAAVPALTKLLKDEDTEVRMSAAWALGHIAPQATTAIPALTELLKDKSQLVREAAASALGDFGPKAKAAIPALRELLKGKDKQVQKAATEALEKIKKEKKYEPVRVAGSEVAADEQQLPQPYDGDGLRVTVTKVQPKNGADKRLRFAVALHNIGDKDLMLNLGMIVGTRQYPTGIDLVLSDEKGIVRKLVLPWPRVAGRVDDYTVPLSVDATHIIVANLDQYLPANPRPELPVQLSEDSYKIVAVFVGKGARHFDPLIATFWMGKAVSEPLEFTVNNRKNPRASF